MLRSEKHPGDGEGAVAWRAKHCRKREDGGVPGVGYAPESGAYEGMTRCCRTCRWFQAASEGRTGECGNPELETRTGIRLVVRSKELHCREGWGEDRWDIAVDDVVLEIRVREPDARPGAGGVRLTDPVASSRSGPPTAEGVICAWGALLAPEAAAER